MISESSAGPSTLHWVQSQAFGQVPPPEKQHGLSLIGALSDDPTGAVRHVICSKRRKFHFFCTCVQMLLVADDLYLLKTTWKRISDTRDVAMHMKDLMVSVYEASGDTIARYTLSGRQVERAAGQQAKRQFSTGMIEIAKGNIKKMCVSTEF
jgi:hypothetical protein